MRRRTFLGALPALPALPYSSSLLPLTTPAPEARVALIGCGWYGKHDLMRLLQVARVEVVGLCDVDRLHLEEAARWVKDRRPGQSPRLYADYRELLERERPEVVLIATPDHWHARMALDALAAGCHLYLQKPVANTVAECEAVLAAARRADRVVQVALQRRSTPHLIEAKSRIVDAGLLGEVHHAEAFCYYRMRDRGRRPVQPIPDHFDYTAWTGPAELLPFRGLPHRRWRSYTAYSNGILGDMCVHMLDLARWQLGLGGPTEVTSHGGIFVDTEADATCTDTQSATMTFPERRLTFTWQHRSWGVPTQPGRPWGLNLHGTDGQLQLDVWGYTFYPRKGDLIRGEVLLEKAEYPEDLDEPGMELQAAPATRRHLRNFMDCVASGARPVADIAEGVVSTVGCVRGVVN